MKNSKQSGFPATTVMVLSSVKKRSHFSTCHRESSKKTNRALRYTSNHLCRHSQKSQKVRPQRSNMTEVILAIYLRKERAKNLKFIALLFKITVEVACFQKILHLRKQGVYLKRCHQRQRSQRKFKFLKAKSRLAWLKTTLISLPIKIEPTIKYWVHTLMMRKY